MIASVTFIAILITILIQAPTTKWLGRRLGLLGCNLTSTSIRVESAALFFLVGMYAVLSLIRVSDDIRSALIEDYLTSQLRSLEPR